MATRSPTDLTLPQGSFFFTCNLPSSLNHPPSALQAWDAADLYLLSLLQSTTEIFEEHKNEHDSLNNIHQAESPLIKVLKRLTHHQETQEPPQSILVAHDQWGVLSTVLAHMYPQAQIIMLHDSRLSQKALKYHIECNPPSNPHHVHFISELSYHSLSQLPLKPLPSSSHPCFDLIIFKSPKNQKYLIEILNKVIPFIHTNTLIIGGAMSKYITSSLIQEVRKVIGPTQTSRARKKARLIMCDRSPSFTQNESTSKLKDTSNPPINPNGSSTLVSTYPLETTPFILKNGTHTFSKKRLDNGTRLLIQHLPTHLTFQNKPHQVLDLGCGNGALGIAYSYHNPKAKLVCTDVSFQAIHHARSNFQTAFPSSNESDVSADHYAEFYALDGLEDKWEAYFDLILLNPPFHQGQAQNENLGKRLIVEAKRALKPGGYLWLVGNRHLQYHIELKKRFGKCTHHAKHSKFVVLSAQKTLKKTSPSFKN